MQIKLGNQQILVTVSRDFDIPYLAGSSQDGRTVYIDKAAPKVLQLGDDLVKPDKYLVAHELIERSFMVNHNYTYQMAHARATKCERLALERDKVNWRSYQLVLATYYKLAKTKPFYLSPPDLFLGPYHSDPEDLHYLQKMGFMAKCL